MRGGPHHSPVGRSSITNLPPIAQKIAPNKFSRYNPPMAPPKRLASQRMAMECRWTAEQVSENLLFCRVPGERRCVVVRGMVYGLAAVILPTLIIAHPHSAASQTMLSCAGRSDVVKFLDRNFTEKLTAVGLINQNSVLEVYAAKSGTWTLVVTDVHGISCILLSGDSWDSMPALPGLAT